MAATVYGDAQVFHGAYGVHGYGIPAAVGAVAHR